jgi:hypothetical protein
MIVIIIAIAVFQHEATLLSESFSAQILLEPVWDCYDIFP